MQKTLSLPSSVQERMTGWMKIQERRGGAPEKPKPGPVITLSREFGCEGFPLAARLHEMLTAGGEGWGLFDRDLLEKVANDKGLSMRFLNSLGDANQLLGALGFHPRGLITHDEAFAKVAETIVKIACDGNAIIVGPGAAALCQGLDNCFHFRLEANFDWRVASMVRRMGLSEAEATKLVKTKSKERERFIKQCVGVEVFDRSLYDCVFNNERHSVEQIASAIVAYVRSAWKAREAHPRLQ